MTPREPIPTWKYVLAVAFAFVVLGLAFNKIDTGTGATGAGPTAGDIAVNRRMRINSLATLSRDEVRQRCKEHEEWKVSDCVLIDQGRVAIGMDADEARLAWGTADSVNTTILANHREEQWVFSGGKAYLYFEDGILTSIQNSSQ